MSKHHRRNRLSEQFSAPPLACWGPLYFPYPCGRYGRRLLTPAVPATSLGADREDERSRWTTWLGLFRSFRKNRLMRPGRCSFGS
jgi:hypothetical protein